MMLEDARVVPTLPVSSIERARRFYEGKVGLTRIEDEVEGTIRYACGGGTGLALFERPTEPLDRTVAAWEVEDIENEVEELRSRGVSVDGVITLPSGVKRAFFSDPDGNVLGIRQLWRERQPPHRIARQEIAVPPARRQRFGHEAPAPPTSPSRFRRE
jgi:catechol 2,3-dioxygenase-like lactoylglutathione lyase family enzyme